MNLVIVDDTGKHWKVVDLSNYDLYDTNDVLQLSSETFSVVRQIEDEAEHLRLLKSNTVRLEALLIARKAEIAAIFAKIDGENNDHTK